MFLLAVELEKIDGVFGHDRETTFVNTPIPKVMDTADLGDRKKLLLPTKLDWAESPVLVDTGDCNRFMNVVVHELSIYFRLLFGKWEFWFSFG